MKEQAQRIENLKASADLVLDPDAYKDKYDLNKEPIILYLADLKSQTFHNAEVPVAIKLSTRTIKKITSTGMSDTDYMKSLAYIPVFAEKAYTMHAVIGKQNDGWYYHHTLTEIEKGSLIDNIQRAKPGYQTSLSDIKDTTLLKILQEPFIKKPQNSEKKYAN